MTFSPPIIDTVDTALLTFDLFNKVCWHSTLLTVSFPSIYRISLSCVSFLKKSQMTTIFAIFVGSRYIWHRVTVWVRVILCMA